MHHHITRVNVVAPQDKGGRLHKSGLLAVWLVVVLALLLLLPFVLAAW